jgi:hypothetical protein
MLYILLILNIRLYPSCGQLRLETDLMRRHNCLVLVVLCLNGVSVLAGCHKSILAPGTLGVLKNGGYTKTQYEKDLKGYDNELGGPNDRDEAKRLRYGQSE